jgi:hypothetical protein
MAKESMKAREVKRLALVEKYAAKRAQYMQKVTSRLCTSSRRTRTRSDCTTVAASRVVRKDTSVSSESAVSLSAKWHLPD